MSEKITSVLQEKMVAINNSIDVLSRNLAEIQEQLSPVLMPPTPVEVRETATEIQSSIVITELGVINERINLLTSEIIYIKDRLQV